MGCLQGWISIVVFCLVFGAMWIINAVIAEAVLPATFASDHEGLIGLRAICGALRAMAAVAIPQTARENRTNGSCP